MIVTLFCAIALAIPNASVGSACEMTSIFSISGISVVTVKPKA